MDKLDQLYAMQRDLNEYIFRKQDLGENAWEEFIERKATPEAMRDWTLNLCRALINEGVELEDSCNWKWWSNDPPIDLQNARVEVVDLWHFLLSLSMVVGLKPEDIFELYSKKYEVNKKRQDDGYSRNSKTEDDNKDLTV